MSKLDKSHLAGLDSLRFAAAGWVALFHGARFPLDRAIGQDGPGEKILVALNNGLFNGVAAVMLFFVLSGFVIHRPYAGGSPLDLRTYYARRLTRIAPPVVVAQLVCLALGPSYYERLSAVLWSLYCEIAYYALYPALLAGFRRYGSFVVFVVASLIAFAVVAATWPRSYYWEFPLPLLLLVGLPNWILGCVLAEARAQNRRPVDPASSIWLWRAGAVLLAAGLKIPVTHGPLTVGYPASHWLVAVYAFFWISQELDYYAVRPAPRLVEAFGAASFSLYLVHNPTIAFFHLAEADAPPFGAGLIGWTASWALQCGAIALATFAFYMLVEAPFHRLARRLGRAAGGQRKSSEQRAAA